MFLTERILRLLHKMQMQEIDIISNALQQAVSFGIICWAEYAICKEPCWLKSVDKRRKNIQTLEHYQVQLPYSLCSCYLCIFVRTLVCKCRHPMQSGLSLSRQYKIRVRMQTARGSEYGQTQIISHALFSLQFFRSCRPTSCSCQQLLFRAITQQILNYLCELLPRTQNNFLLRLYKAGSFFLLSLASLVCLVHICLGSLKDGRLCCHQMCCHIFHLKPRGANQGNPIFMI